ncbi:MAG TPA: signal peptidase I [Bacteroidota bacterium]
MTKDKKQEQQKKEQVSLGRKSLLFLKEVGIVLGLFLVINSFVFASFLVPTGSMENEVLTGELLFVNKFIYGATSPRNVHFTNIRLPFFRLPAVREPHRNDVIVFVWPGNRDEVQNPDFTFYLKRCMALPGDTIQVIDRVVYVNGVMAPIPRNIKFDHREIWPRNTPDDGIFPKGKPWNQDQYGPLVIPRKGMRVPLSSKDYDEWAIFIQREGHSIQRLGDEVLVDGKPVTEYTVQRDYLFAMGDHRDNSLDSRYWGFVPREDLVGTPMVVYWSWDSDIPLYDIFGRIASIRWGRIGSLIE